jgi:hypothetical protein
VKIQASPDNLLTLASAYAMIDLSAISSTAADIAPRMLHLRARTPTRLQIPPHPALISATDFELLVVSRL